MKVLIGVPSNRREIPVYFVQSLFEIMAETKKEHQTELLIYGTTYLECMRNKLCDYAIENNFDYLFMTDSDEIYPGDTITRLLSHNKDVVCGFYQSRKSPFKPVQFKLGTEYTPESINNPENWVRPDNELQEIQATGMGGVLIKVEALKKLKEPFYLNMIEDNKRFLGEDLYFCKKLNEAGIKIYCDTSLVFAHEMEAFIKNNQMIIKN